MSFFGDTFTEIGLPALQETSGKTVSYTAPGGTTPTSVTAIVGDERDTEVTGQDGLYSRQEIDVIIPIATVVPVKGAKITIGSVDYYVTEIVSETESCARCVCVLVDVTTVGRDGNWRNR